MASFVLISLEALSSESWMKWVVRSLTLWLFIWFFRTLDMFSMLIGVYLSLISLLSPRLFFGSVLFSFVSSPLYLLDWGASWQAWPIPSIIALLIAAIFHTITVFIVK